MNIQQHIIKGIKGLLYSHDFLVIPGFGGFVLNHRPSHFSVSGGAIIPPTKTVGFNLQLKQNDGVLQQWLQHDLPCTAQESIDHVNEFADYCNSLLKVKRRINFEGIGFFYLDFESNICFEPQADTNFLTESFGLGTLTITPLTPAESRPLESKFDDRVLSEATNLPKEHIKKSRQRYLLPAALTSLMFIFLIVVVTNTKITGTLKAALNGSTSKTVYVPHVYVPLNLETYETNAIAYLVDANGYSSVQLGESKNLPVKVLNLPETSRLTASPTKSEKSSVKKGYEIVLGCFTVLDNAKRMASKLRTKNNLKANVSEKNEKGMHVVSTGNYTNKEEAIQELNSLKITYPKAWIKQP